MRSRPSQNVMYVAAHNGLRSRTPSFNNKRNFFYGLFEKIYDKCAGYNLRYCPLRSGNCSEQNLTSAARHLVILLIFLVANFVVFLNIAIKMTIYLYLFVKDTTAWIKKCTLKSECSDPIYLETVE